MTRAFTSLLGASAAIAVLLPSSVFGMSLLVGDYRHPKPEWREFSKLWLDGVKQGLITYSVIAQRNKQQPLFCIPDKLALTVEQAEDIMLRWAKTLPLAATDDLLVEVALLHALEETFPCK